MVFRTTAKTHPKSLRNDSGPETFICFENFTDLKSVSKREWREIRKEKASVKQRQSA